MSMRVFFLALSCLAATPVNSEITRPNYFINCSSTQLSLTFEINTLLRTVRNVNYNTDMDVSYWSEDTINSIFSKAKSLAQIVAWAPKTDNVSVNFDRLKGAVSVAGLIAPTEAQVNQCKLERNWGCDSWIVVEVYDAECSIVEKRF